MNDDNTYMLCMVFILTDNCLQNMLTSF